MASVASYYKYPDSKVHGANMGPTWVLSVPDGPHVAPMNLTIRVNIINICIDLERCTACILGGIRLGYITNCVHQIHQTRVRIVVGDLAKRLSSFYKTNPNLQRIMTDYPCGYKKCYGCHKNVKCTITFRIPFRNPAAQEYE